MQNILNQHKSIIVLNGALPDKKLLPFINTHVPIIAADGAVMNMHKLRLVPTYVVGDGDSCKKNYVTTATIIHAPDQNFTDFEKCILFAQENNLFPALVLGVSGGEIDHTLGNMQAIVKHAREGSLYFLDTYKKVRTKRLGIKMGIPLVDKKLELKLAKNSLISIVPFGTTHIKSEGLCWELGGFTFTHDSILGIRNISVRNIVSFDMQQGRALLVVDISDYFGTAAS